MNNLIVTEFKDIRVLTTQQLAERYETDSQVITNNFNRNKDRYQEGKHYIALEGNEKREFLNLTQIDLGSTKKAKTLYLWTSKGCLLHAKSVGTDKAWEVYEELIDTYFSIQEVKKLSHEEIMRIQLNMVDNHEERIEKLENNMTIDHGQAQDLKQAGAKRIIDLCGGKNSAAYKEVGRKIFAELWHDFKEYFHINSYRNTLTSKFDEAIAYVENWTPSNNTLILIRNCNSQIHLVV